MRLGTPPPLPARSAPRPVALSSQSPLPDLSSHSMPASPGYPSRKWGRPGDLLTSYSPAAGRASFQDLEPLRLGLDNYPEFPPASVSPRVPSGRLQLQVNKEARPGNVLFCVQQPSGAAATRGPSPGPPPASNNMDAAQDRSAGPKSGHRHNSGILYVAFPKHHSDGLVCQTTMHTSSAWHIVGAH